MGSSPDLFNSFANMMLVGVIREPAHIWTGLGTITVQFLILFVYCKYFNISRNPNNQVSKYLLTGRKEEVTFNRKETSAACSHLPCPVGGWGGRKEVRCKLTFKLWVKVFCQVVHVTDFCLIFISLVNMHAHIKDWKNIGNGLFTIIILV